MKQFPGRKSRNRRLADIVSPAVRSRMMAGIRGKNTKPEMIVRRGLHRLGHRYRLHDQKLPGKPDLVFPKYKAALFVNGCFWHGHNCNDFKLPQTRTSFWKEKIDGNRIRDVRARTELEQLGWRHMTIWECELKRNSADKKSLFFQRISKWLAEQRDLN